MVNLRRGIACLLLLGLCIAGARAEIAHRQYAYSQEAFGNPLMGYAPCAWYDELREDVTLLYMDITWRELEPQEGMFDWEAIEAENQIDRWREEGRHIVLRFVCDVPGQKAHLDIPDWLYEKTNHAGTWYAYADNRQGFSPDYGNASFIAYHARAIQALGDRYGRDGLVSFVELGSLGHWGEWHVELDAGVKALPKLETRREYVRMWREAFPEAFLLLRRPFLEGQELSLGLYNDMSGHREATEEWMDWIMFGDDFSQTGEADALVPMPEGWKNAPIGGELTSSLSMERMLADDLRQTLRLIRGSHTTFLGPKTADPEYEEGYFALLGTMGYRLWISEAAVERAETCFRVTLTWQNSGIAPFYASWPVYLYTTDSEGNLQQTQPVDIALSTLLPGESRVSVTELPLEKADALWLGIVDPMTGRDAVRLCMEGALWQDGRTLLMDSLP